ncbi:uncharacterized protein [Watersipora subatra]|uniref:uncharacterized protein n=1 Tax=Watersipora subatra TaxID=2589382 RepID=UPI00355B2136
MSDSKKFAKDCLAAHNEKRKKHGVSKLKLNQTLCLLAENWAKVLLSSGNLKHSNAEHNGSPLGENIAAKTSTGTHCEYTAHEAVDQWYSEIKDYDFSGHSTGIKTGHFSQVVWKDSKELGVAMVSKGGKCIVVANYHPAGNYVGKYKENVFPMKSTVKSVVVGGRKENSSSSSSDEEGGAQSRPQPDAVAKAASIDRAKFGTSKVTVTKTITHPDGTVETITEERIEENVSPKNLLSDPNQPEIKCTFKQSGEEFKKDALRAHNNLRALHHVPNLELNYQLCDVAQKWADHLATIGSLQHSNGSHMGTQLGENIASRWGSRGADYTGEEVTQQWYSEESAYDYGGKNHAGKTGHFTQVVWKDSKELGIGKAADTKGRVYVVANYKPAGNYIGNFTCNVLPK